MYLDGIWHTSRFAGSTLKLLHELYPLYVVDGQNDIGIRMAGAYRIGALLMPLNFWRKYCGVSVPDILEQKSCELLYLYVMYFKLWDSIVDSEGERRNYLANPAMTRTDLRFTRITSCIARSVSETPISTVNKRKIIQAIRDFRITATQACIVNAQDHINDKQIGTDELLPYRWATSGLMYGYFARILNCLHDVPTDMAVNSQAILIQWALVIQIVDDLLDIVSDFGQDQNNLFLVLLNCYPEEKLKVQALVGKGLFPVLSSISTVAPTMFNSARTMFEAHLTEMCSIDQDNKTVREEAANIRSAFLCLSSAMTTKTIDALLRSPIRHYFWPLRV